MKIGARAHDFGKMTIENMANLLKQKGYECTQLALPRAFTEIDSFHGIRTEHLERIRQTFEDVTFSFYGINSRVDVIIIRKRFIIIVRLP